LAEALAAFEGAVVLVSHDRQLLQTCVDQFFMIHQGQLQPFEGDLEDYAKHLASQRKQAASESARRVSTAAPPQAVPTSLAASSPKVQASKQQLQQWQKALSKAETRLQTLEASIQLLETRMAKADFYLSETAQQVYLEHGQLKQEQEEVELHWIEVSDLLESAGAPALNKR
jgi:ATP-binding cassette, subfamily F, member 3